MRHTRTQLAVSRRASRHRKAGLAASARLSGHHRGRNAQRTQRASRRIRSWSHPPLTYGDCGIREVQCVCVCVSPGKMSLGHHFAREDAPSTPQGVVTPPSYHKGIAASGRCNAPRGTMSLDVVRP